MNARTLAACGVAAAVIYTLFGCASTPQTPKENLVAADQGTVWFVTAGKVVGPPVNLRVSRETELVSGVLRFPSDAGKVPAVIIAHGCAGPHYAERSWQLVLRSWGYATFVLDSFSGRGLREVCTTNKLLPHHRLPDVYGAIRVLATHPRIDPQRVALLGFSHGGIVTLEAATRWAKETFGQSDGVAYKAFFPFYPWCGYNAPEFSRLTAPIRFHLGERDDWTPAKPCLELVAALRAEGNDAAATVCQGAAHSFDDNNREAFLPDVENWRNCELKGSSILGPYSFERSCVKKGATSGRNARALEEAKRVLRVQLSELGFK